MVSGDCSWLTVHIQALAVKAFSGLFLAAPIAPDTCLAKHKTCLLRIDNLEST